MTEALAANIGNSTGSFSVSRNKNHYTKENPERTGLVTWGLSCETAIFDPKTNISALESLLEGGFCGRRAEAIIIGLAIYPKAKLLNMQPALWHK